MSFVAAATAAVSVGGAAFKLAKGAKQNKLANKVVIPDANYEVSPYAKSVLGEATRLKNSRMEGAASAERNIYGAGANAGAAVGRNATSSSQALALLASINGNTNSAFSDLQQKEQQYDMNTLTNWNNANDRMTTENDKLFQDKVRKQDQRIAEKNALRGAATTNTGNGINDIQNAAAMFAAYRNPNPKTTP